MKKNILFLLIPLFLLEKVMAHCPLCTIGAGAAAAGAVWLGVSKVVVSLFIGALGVSMGWWFSRLIKKQYIPFQKPIIIILSFLLTVIPIMPIMGSISPLYISLFGEYGSMFNRTYMVDLSLFGSVFGGLIVCSTPSISKKITKLREGKMVPFQGIILTFALLILAGGVVQLLV